MFPTNLGVSTSTPSQPVLHVSTSAPSQPVLHVQDVLEVVDISSKGCRFEAYLGIELSSFGCSLRRVCTSTLVGRKIGMFFESTRVARSQDLT